MRNHKRSCCHFPNATVPCVRNWSQVLVFWNALTLVDTPICGRKQPQCQNIQFWVQTWCKLCCALFALASGLRCAVPHPMDEENKRQAERRLSSMTCWETAVCRRWQKSSILWPLSRWDSDISPEIETNFPEISWNSWPFLVRDCCLGSSGHRILIRKRVCEQVSALAADHSESGLQLDRFTDAWHPTQKLSLLAWCVDINTMNISVGLVRFVFKIPVEISIVSLGTWPRRSPHYDYVKCFTLTFLSQNSSKVNWALIVPFLPAFYQGLVTFFFVCLCAFPNLFFFPCVYAGVFFPWKMTNGKCENGSLWTWGCHALHTCVQRSFREYAYLFISMNALLHVYKCMCVCRCIGVNRRRYSWRSGKVLCVRLIEHGRIMTAVYTRSPISILAHLLALSALADRWKPFSFQCSGKSADVIRQSPDLDAEPGLRSLNISLLKCQVNDCMQKCASN